MKITSFPFLLTVLAFAGFVNAGGGYGNGYGQPIPCEAVNVSPDDIMCNDGYARVCSCVGDEEVPAEAEAPAHARELQGIRKGRNTMKLREAHDEAVENANIASHQHRRALESKSSKAACPDGTVVTTCVHKTGKSGKNAWVPVVNNPI
jgi:hypothetical protein